MRFGLRARTVLCAPDILLALLCSSLISRVTMNRYWIWITPHLRTTYQCGWEILELKSIPCVSRVLRMGEWKHAEPMQYQEFAGSQSARQRYWARSYVGWQKFGKAEPNAAHRSLAALESAGTVDAVITQNVDRLHSRAGSRRVIDLHGTLDAVVCLDCERREARDAFQLRIRSANGDWHADVFQFHPDGDAELAIDSHRDFHVPGCASCGGSLKPDVVMFGESVPKPRVDAAMEAVDRTDALLVVGSSLMVFSGYRFARHATATGKPIAVLNRGKTRADDIAEVRIDADCGAVLESFAVEVSTAAESGSNRATSGVY